MAALIIAYDDQKIADKAIAALREEGIEDRQVRILSGATKTLVSELSEHGFDDDDARAYAKAADEGKSVVVAEVSEEKADQAQSIMDRVASDGGASEESSFEVSSTGSVPVAEEEVSVNKTKTTNGGVRVTSSVSETPVEETVTLTTETVGTERRSADRVLTGEEAEAAFEEKTVEMMGTREEAEIQKEARVVGEVELTKETEARQKTVEDTVRKTDVEVEHVAAGTTKK